MERNTNKQLLSITQLPAETANKYDCHQIFIIIFEDEVLTLAERYDDESSWWKTYKPSFFGFDFLEEPIVRQALGAVYEKSVPVRLYEHDDEEDCVWVMSVFTAESLDTILEARMDYFEPDFRNWEGSVEYNPDVINL